MCQGSMNLIILFDGERWIKIWVTEGLSIDVMDLGSWVRQGEARQGGGRVPRSEAGT